MAPTC